MKAVILAAGYGTRLQRDVAADCSGRFAHLAGVPKPLVPVGRSQLLTLWISALNRSACVDAVYVVTNDLYFADFQLWAESFSNVTILSDGTKNNDERLGAVADLQLVLRRFNISDDVVVIGGDTLFREDFSLTEVKEKFTNVQARRAGSCLVLSYQCADHETEKYGILEVDEDLRVVCMKEKPRPSDTTSRRACPCFYVFSQRSLPLLDTFLTAKKDAPMEEKDAPGNFVSWLILRNSVYVHPISGRFDVGNLTSYVDCDVYFKEKLQDADRYMV